MSKTRTPPPLQPKGWEKSDFHIDVSLTETEMLLWQSVFGKSKMSDTIRRIVNVEVYARAGIPTSELPDSYELKPDAAIRFQEELKRHKDAVMAMMKQESQ